MGSAVVVVLVVNKPLLGNKPPGLDRFRRLLGLLKVVLGFGVVVVVEAFFGVLLFPDFEALDGGVGRASGGLLNRSRGFWLRLDEASVVVCRASVVSPSSPSTGSSVMTVVRSFSSSAEA